MKNSEKVNKKLDAKSQAIKLFLEEKQFISIPRYQREYSWEKNNVIDFINDIDKGYYIGNIILYDENNVCEVIDGRQRLITSFLILIALRNLTTDTDNKFKRKIDNLLYYDGKCRLILKDRIGSDGHNILNEILDNDENIAEPIKKYNEIKNYFLIKNNIKDLNYEKLFNKLVNSILVGITFYENITDAYEMFVNINTKGKPLSEIEILKSSLFKYLLSKKNSDTFKDKWQNMLKKIPEKDYSTFVSDTYLFYKFENSDLEKLKTSGTVKENFRELIKEITDFNKALRVFDIMTDNSLKNIYLPYVAIKTYDINSLSNEYYKDFTTSLNNIHELWKLIGEYKFVQSDILFACLFKDKEKFIENHSGFIYSFMKYLFIYEISRSIAVLSPAHYSNRFKQVSKDVYNEKDPSKLKKIIKNFVQELEIDYEKLKTELVKPERFIKNHKIAKYIIMLSEGYMHDKLTVEHFIFQKTKNDTEKKYVGSLGNLIPVIKDKYKNKNVKEKLELYKQNSVHEIGIKNFLEYGFDEKNYLKMINIRAEKIAAKFIELSQECYKQINI